MISSKETMQKDAPKDKDHLKGHRTLMIFLMTMIGFGSCFAYDIPQTLQTQLQSPPLNLTFVQFNGLYSVYSTPNVFLPFLGGLFINFIGLNTSVLLFTFFAFAGQLLLSCGISSGDYSMMVWGRMFYALGAESQSIAQSIMAVKWFSSKELTTVLGWNTSFGYLGSNLNIAISPWLFAVTGRLWVPCFVGTFFCFLSFVCGVGYVILDQYLHKRMRSNETAEILQEHQPKCKDIKGVSKTFWIMCAYFFIFYLSIDGVTVSINDQIHKRFGFSNTAAGQLVLIYYLQLVIVPIFIGKLVDKTGNRVQWLIFVAFTGMVGQALLGYLPNVQERGFIVILPLLILGFSDAVFETVSWSCLLLSLEPNMAAIGYGFAISGMNLLNVFGMIVLGKVQDSTVEVSYGYFYSQLFLAGVSGVAMVIACVALFADPVGLQKLSAPAVEEEKVEGDEKESICLLEKDKSTMVDEDTSLGSISM